MELLCQRHVAVNFDASLHMGSDELSPAFNNVDEIRFVTADRAIGLALCLLDMDRAIVHSNKPAAHLLDVEKISSADAPQNGLIHLRPVKVEYFLGGLRHTMQPPFLNNGRSLLLQSQSASA